MAELSERLQTTLGSAYRLEKELGGGGMSRVFVAEETRLARRVVIKVLPPDLALEMRVDRFNREIQLSASLQHPHIVPLLAAGGAEDLLVPQLREFLNAGGTIIAIGGSTSLTTHLGLPFTNHLVADGRPLPDEKFYLPGSVLQVRVDNTRPIAYGLGERVDVFFDESPVFRTAPGAAPEATRPVAWYDADRPLRSGWAWGQEHLKGGLAAAEASVGRGTLYLFGPEILFRAQPHGTFKFLFNGIHLARMAGGRTATTSDGSR